jgi:hypothetical protein
MSISGGSGVGSSRAGVGSGTGVSSAPEMVNKKGKARRVRFVCDYLPGETFDLVLM